MKTIKRYESDDGLSFDTREECALHELLCKLVGLTIEQVKAAMDGRDPALGDVIEEAGRRRGDTRRGAGQLRRTPNGGVKLPDDVKPVAQTIGTLPPEVAPDDEDLSPSYRGDRDFKAGKPGVIPDDLRDDPEKREKYLAAWDAASFAAGQAGKAAA